MKIISEKIIHEHEVSTHIGSTSIDDHHKSTPTSSEEEEKISGKRPRSPVKEQQSFNQNKRKKKFESDLQYSELEEYKISPNKKTKVTF